MNKLMTLVLGLGLSVPLAGCGPTLVEGGPEHQRRIARNMNLDMKQAVEDLDYWALTDEPSHLSPYYMPHKVH